MNVGDQWIYCVWISGWCGHEKGVCVFDNILVIVVDVLPVFVIVKYI